LRKHFRPEFLNRLDDVIVFRALSRDEIASIVELRLDEVRERMAPHGMKLEVTDDARHFLGDEGYDPEYGARPLRRVITNLVEDRLSDGILSGTFADAGAVLVDYDEDIGELTFTPKDVKEGVEPVEDPAPLN
jgi:ATP-dependent Clp protease ATP-binding subunit ClpA